MAPLKKVLFAAVAVILLVAGSANAEPFTYNFSKITNNNVENLGDQLSVEVIGLLDGSVDFKFLNNVGTASSICDIYFYDGTLLNMGTLDPSAGVSFGTPANPPGLPGLPSTWPSFTKVFSADSNTPSALENGINTSAEYLVINFSLFPDTTYSDTIAALADGSLRIGLHVQGIGAEGGSDGYVNRVPDGGMTLSLLGLALAGIGLMARRKN